MVRRARCSTRRIPPRSGPSRPRVVGGVLYHDLRRAEACALRVPDLQMRCGVPHLRVHGKGGKVRHLPLDPAATDWLHAYLEAAGHAELPTAPLFQPLHTRARAGAALSPMASTASSGKPRRPPASTQNRPGRARAARHVVRLAAPVR